MTNAEIKTYLAAENLTQFSLRHRINLRTLMRFKSGAVTPSEETVKAVLKAIAKDKKKAEDAQAS